MKKQVMRGAILFATILSATSCTKNDDNLGGSDSSKGDILVSIMQPNPDGMSGSSYMQLIDSKNLEAGINLKNAIPIPYGSTAPIQCGNDIFIFPSYMGDSANKLIKYTIKDGRLVKTGELALQANNGATNIVKISDNKAYLSLAGLGKIMVFNPSTMEKIKDIDLSTLGIKDNNPDPGSMIYRDGYLFVGLNQMVAGYNPPADYKQADVAIINTNEDTLHEMISTKVGSITMATRPVAPRSIFMDENEDIYISCVGSFGYVQEHNCGIIRIKKNELNFDEDYNWVIKSETVAGDDRGGNPGFISSIIYAGNGVAYGYCDVPAYYNQGENGMTAYSNIPVKFDVYNKTMTMVEGLDLSNGYAVMCSEIDGDIIFANASRKNRGIYKLDKSTNSVESKPIFSTDYNIWDWVHLK